MMRSFLQCLRYLLQKALIIFGRYNDVLAYPLLIASYIVPVRQYRILPFDFLHCIPCGKPACHLLIFLDTTPAYKGLAPFGTNTVHKSFWCSRNKFAFFKFIQNFQLCALSPMQGTHKKHIFDYCK